MQSVITRGTASDMEIVEMVCNHLKELYQLCQDHQLRLGGADLIRVVYKQCDQQEACPSTLMDEYDAIASEKGSSPPKTGPDPNSPGAAPGETAKT